MIVLLYIVTVILFCILAMILPIIPGFIVTRVLNFQNKEGEWDLWMTAIIIGSSYVLALFTDYVWKSLNYEMGWTLIIILAVIHFFFGGQPGINQSNKNLSYGTMIGVIIYGFIGMN